MTKGTEGDALFYPISSGSCGNAVYVRCGNLAFLVDCGLPGRRVCEALSSIGEDAAAISFILVTHSHLDHTKGVGVLARKYRVPVHCSRGTWEFMSQDARVGPIPPECRCPFDGCPEIETPAETVRITPFSTPHDAEDSVGYRIEYAGRTAAIATDLGYVSKEVKAALYGADLVLLESNHDIDMLMDGPYPLELKKRVCGNRGHLSNRDAGRFAAELVRRGTKQIYLGHISQENNTPRLAMAAVCEELRRAGVDPQRDVRLRLARRGEPSEAAWW